MPTVHSVAQEPKAAEDSQVALALVHQSSDRQRQIFKEQHIRKAWQRLDAENWLNSQ
ncbi:hypothetical protein [Microseira wollei]|uniref:hypothetical protein n=1 Tax=Microseira wollei TaxID=467598 RepID=UPI001CFDBE4E|nr:hypothetical protein [Microseira wollei]